MKAPEKIYLQVCGDCDINDCENCKFEDLEDNVTWCKDKIFDKDVEYTHTDAFIEKACLFIKEHHHEFSFWNTEEYELGFSTQKFIEDFKNYMKGE